MLTFKQVTSAFKRQHLKSKGVLVVALAAIVASTQGANADTRPDQLQRLINAHRAATPVIPGELLSVQTPDFQWTGATGTLDGKSTKLRKDDAYRIASNTKPFTAAAILRLMETGKIDIYSPIGPLISSRSAERLRRGGYNPGAITVQQLLDHTSGIADYAVLDSYVKRVLEDPRHQWTRDEQIKFAMENGKKVGQPGAKFGYSDTGYVLLGEIIERRTGKSLGTAVRSLLRFDRLGLRDTYWEKLEPRRANLRVSHNFFGETDFSSADPSYDMYGGGGLVSTTSNLLKFYRALVRGAVFEKPSTLAVMMTSAPAAEGNNALQFISFGRYQCWGHGGFWGQVTVHCPGPDISFAWTINQATVEPQLNLRFVNDLAAIIAR